MNKILLDNYVQYNTSTAENEKESFTQKWKKYKETLHNYLNNQATEHELRAIKLIIKNSINCQRNVKFREQMKKEILKKRVKKSYIH